MLKFFPQVVLTTLSALSLSSANATCETKTLRVNELDRSGIVCSSVDSSVPAPLVLVFHGRGSSANEMQAATHLESAWPEAVVVYLEGLSGNPAPHDPQGLKSGWQINPGDMNNRDVAFVDVALNALTQHYPIDRRKVFAVGHSNGARFVGVLWALRGKQLAALAFSAAQADTLIQTAEPRSVFMGMGVHDDLAPFAWQQQSIKYAADLLNIRSIDFTYDGVRGAKNRNGLELLTLIHQGGHIWPIGQTRLIVEFLKRQNL